MNSGKAFALSCLLFVLAAPSAHACSFSVAQKSTNSWQENGVTMYQYDVSVTNTGETLSALNFYANAGVSQYWSTSPNGDGSLGLPSWYSSGFGSGASWGWGLVTAGPLTFSWASAPGGCAVDYQGAASGTGSGSGNPNPPTPSTPTSFCTGNPPTYNGLPCASTTRYFDGTMGACGCGSGEGAPYEWQRYAYTAASSQAIFGAGTWCGGGCGSCYELTPTGDCPTGGPCASSTAPIVVMVTNLCPNQGNYEWCPNPGQNNAHGYAGHFDLQDAAQAISKLGWNNPVVTYRQVACGARGSPSCGQAGQCKCSTSQCSAGGVTSYGVNKNYTSVNKKPTTYSVKEQKEKGIPTYGIVLIAAGIAAAVCVVGGMILYAVVRKRAAVLIPRTEPLLDYTEHSDL